MIKVLLNGKQIAQSNDSIVVEGNHYIPVDSINSDFLEKSELKTTCPWKGVASYYHLNVDGKQLKDKIWYYPNPKEEAKEIKGRIAFYQNDGIQVIEE